MNKPTPKVYQGGLLQPNKNESLVSFMGRFVRDEQMRKRWKTPEVRQSTAIKVWFTWGKR